MQTTPRRIIGILIVCLVSLAFLYFALISHKETGNKGKLKGEVIRTDAEVTNWRINRSHSRIGAKHTKTQYEIQYNFIAIDGNAYSYSDAEGRRNCWVALPQDQWQETQLSGKVEVIYSAEDPRDNRPAALRYKEKSEALSGMVMFLVLATLFVAVCSIILRKVLTR